MKKAPQAGLWYRGRGIGNVSGRYPYSNAGISN